MKPIDWLRKRASSLGARENGFTPPRWTLPPLGESRVPRMFRRVDWPDPLGPTTARRSPGDKSRLTPRSTTSGWVGVRYSLRSSETRRSAVGMAGDDRDCSPPKQRHRRGLRAGVGDDKVE